MPGATSASSRLRSGRCSLKATQSICICGITTTSLRRTLLPLSWPSPTRCSLSQQNSRDSQDFVAQIFVCLQNTSVIVVHVARPDVPVADRSRFADTDISAAAKGAYLIRDYDNKNPPSGTVLVQGASSTVNLLSVLPRLEAEGINVRVVAVISEELFRAQPVEYQEKVIGSASSVVALPP